MRLIATTLLAAALTAAAATTALAGDVAATLEGDWRSRVGGVTQTITFDPVEGRVFGDSGCNRFTGPYRVSGGRIEIGPLATTMMACPEPQMRAERLFVARMQAATRFTTTADGSAASLVGDQGTVRLRAR